MKRAIIAVALALALVLSAAPVSAGVMEGANAAYTRGDYAEAMRLWHPLAEQGNPNAQYMLGNMYYKGEGVPQDYAEAKRWYRKAAEQGYAIVAYHFGNYQAAMGMYRELAEQGDVEAQNYLGHMYNQGMGVPEDFAEAAKWYRKAAEQGDAGAQSSLGLMYLSGKGVPQDFVQGYKWLILALAQDDEPCTDTSDSQDQEHQDVMEYMCEQKRSIAATSRQRRRELLSVLRGKITREQVAEAQRLAREWKPK